MSHRSTLTVALLLTAMIACSGCTYAKNRGNDALDILDVGVTTSKEPGFSLYAGFLNILSLGYSNVDGTLRGIGGGDTGAIPMRHNAAGALLWGREQMGYDGAFDPEDPESPQPHGVAPIGLLLGPLPSGRHAVDCPKLLHLGWVGLTLNCHFAELADFLLGWTTLDILGDDYAAEAGASEVTQ